MSELATLLKMVMVQKARPLLPSQLAAEIGVSHSTMSRWLSGKATPDIASCLKLAMYSGMRVDAILIAAGHIKQ